MNTLLSDDVRGIPFCDIPSALVKATIPVHKWHRTTTGALEDFMEMLRTEAVSLHRENGRLTLHIMVAVPYIGHAGTRMQELYEAYQLRQDERIPGRVCYKSRLFKGSLGETMHRYWDGRIENGLAATRRGIREELGWDDSSLYDLSAWHGDTWETSEPAPSDKYLGLYDVYHRYKTHCIVSDELYNPEGYTHIDTAKKKKEVFLWRDI